MGLPTQLNRLAEPCNEKSKTVPVTGFAYRSWDEIRISILASKIEEGMILRDAAVNGRVLRLSEPKVEDSMNEVDLALDLRRW